MKCLLAADLGGTLSRLAVCSCEGTMLEQIHITGFGLAEDDKSQPLPELSETIEAICQKWNIRAAAVNLGGKNKGQIERIFRTHIPVVSVFRESEGKAAFAIGESADIVLMAGTGTIVAARAGSKKVICGGWGANISDEGSGYEIGLKAVKTSLRELDGTAPLSLLTKEITGMNKPFSAVENCGDLTRLRDNVRARLFPLERSHIASYCMKAGECSAEGDTVAQSLFIEAGKELAEVVIRTYRKIDLQKPADIIVSGGLVKAKKFWQGAFEGSLKEEISVSSIRYEPDGLMKAVIKIAEKLYREGK